jgi:hypothetical protein
MTDYHQQESFLKTSEKSSSDSRGQNVFGRIYQTTWYIPDRARPEMGSPGSATNSTFGVPFAFQNTINMLK